MADKYKYKLAASLGLAALAGLTAMAAGLMSGVRISVILGRTLCSFFITGVLVYIGVFLFERLGFAAEIKETEAALAALAPQEAVEDGGTAENSAEDEAAAGGTAAEAGQSAEASGERAQDGFAPLQPDSLQRVSGRADNQQQG